MRTPFADDPRRKPDRDRVGWHIARDDSPGAYYRPAPNADTPQHAHAASQPDILLQHDRSSTLSLLPDGRVRIFEYVVFADEGAAVGDPAVVPDLQSAVAIEEYLLVDRDVTADTDAFWKPDRHAILDLPAVNRGHKNLEYGKATDIADRRWQILDQAVKGEEYPGAHIGGYWVLHF